MVGHKYTEEEHEFLHSFIPGHTYKEIVDAYNARFDDDITPSRVKSYIGNHKLNTGKTGYFEKGNIPHNKGKPHPTVGRMAETQYKKGNLPHNTKPIGYERISRDGYVEVKIAMRPGDVPDGHNFVSKHRLVWEAANGPIPKGHKVIFLDGDKLNYALENLALVTDAEHLELTRSGLRTDNTEFTKTGVLIARSKVITNKKRSKVK